MGPLTPLKMSLQRLDIGDNPGLAWTDPVQNIFGSPAGGGPGYTQLDEL